MPLTPAQQAVYRPLVQQAWVRTAVMLDRDHKDLSARRLWYETQIYGVVKVKSTKDAEISPDDFHDLLLRFATLANDAKWLTRLAIESERRLKYLIGLRLAKLASLEGRPVTWAYAVATYTRMQLPLTIDETPAEYLKPLLHALDTHVRRLARKRRSKPDDLTSESPCDSRPAFGKETHLRIDSDLDRCPFAQAPLAGRQ